MKADLVLHNGRIWTAEPALPWSQAVAIKGNHLIAVGEDRDMPEAQRRIDLGGRLVLPGLWDAHIHFYYWSLGLQQVQLAGTASLQEMLDRIRDQADLQHQGAWVSGWGWNETFWEEGREPTRHDLDKVTGLQSPAVFWRADMHSAVANTNALTLAGMMEAVPEVPGGVIELDEEGRPTGILRELAVNLIRDHIPAPTGLHTEEAMLAGMKQLHKLGITGICDQRMKDQEDGPKALAALARLNRQQKLRLRVNCNIAAHNLSLLEALGLSSPMGDERLRLGHVKIFCDGTLGSRTAWMLQPMLGSEDTGLVLTPPEQIKEEIMRATELGFPVSIHAIGDRANRICLDLFEEVRSLGAEPPLIPHRIEHVQLIDKDDIPRLAELGLCASMQPSHILDDMDTADNHLGARADLAYRMGELARSRALLAFGSDAPVSEINPFYGLHGALFRQRPERMEQGAWYEDQCMSLESSLQAYTIGAARAAGWERLTGSLVPGKRADLCVLDRDLFEIVKQPVRSTEVSDTQVLLTVFDGEVVHDSLGLESPALAQTVS